LSGPRVFPPTPIRAAISACSATPAPSTPGEVQKLKLAEFTKYL
jgi:hypothetical protein